MSSDEEVSPPTKAARIEANDGIGGLPTPIASPAGDPPPPDVTDFQTLSTELEQHFAKLEQNFSAQFAQLSTMFCTQLTFRQEQFEANVETKANESDH